MKNIFIIISLILIAGICNAEELFWTKISTFPDQVVNDMVIDADGNIYAGTDEDGIYKSENAGMTWELVKGGISVNAMLIAPDGTVFAGSDEEGVFRSIDGGQSWQRKINGIDENPRGERKVLSLAADSSNNIYCGTLTGGLYRSDDSGENWERLDESIFSDIVGIRALAFGPDLILYAGLYLRGVAISSDNGDSWVLKDLSENQQENTVESLGAIQSDGNDYVFAGTQHNGIFRSTTGGATWQQDTNGVVNTLFNYYSIAFSPDGHVFTSTYKAGIYESTDFGETWTKIANEISDRIIYDIEFDPEGLPYAAADDGLYSPRVVESKLRIEIVQTPPGGTNIDWGQTANFSMTVYDSQDNPIPDANIRIVDNINDEEKNFRTNKDGWAFYGSTVPNETERGAYQLTFQATKDDYGDSRTYTKIIDVFHSDPAMLYIDVTPVEKQVIDLNTSATYDIHVFDHEMNPVSAAVVNIIDTINHMLDKPETDANGDCVYIAEGRTDSELRTGGISFIAEHADFTKSELQIRWIEFRHEPSLELKMFVTPDTLLMKEWLDSAKYLVHVTDGNDEPVEEVRIVVYDTLSMTFGSELFTEPNGKVYYTSHVPDQKPFGIYNMSFSASKDGFYSPEREVRSVEVIDASGVEIARASRQIEVFPNPASSEINILIPGYTGHVRIRLLDLAGRELSDLYEGHAAGSFNMHWNIASLVPGSYILLLEPGDERYVRKIVKTE